MNSSFENDYKKLLIDCLRNGELTKNRTAIKTKQLFNQTLNINLQQGFPVVTSKKIFFKKALAEFKWIYEGRTDLQYLHKHKIFWWDDFAKNNNLGKVYGYQVKKFNGIFDQIEYAINEIKNNSRRALITLWNPTDLQDQALPCCYTQFNFMRSNGKLNMAVNFRSSDLFLGLPYDIIVCALFLNTIAKETGLQPNMLGLNLINAHIYENHNEAVNEYLNAVNHKLPILKGNYNEYRLDNYKHEQYIKAELVL
jgi:thymidylate synthase